MALTWDGPGKRTCTGMAAWYRAGRAPAGAGAGAGPDAGAWQAPQMPAPSTPNGRGRAADNRRAT